MLKITQVMHTIHAGKKVAKSKVPLMFLGPFLPSVLVFVE